MKLLMHICCANCSLYPFQSFRDRGIKTAGLWFNPNIHPYAEYRERLNALKFLEKEWRLEIDYRDQYGLKDFVRAVANREESRCEYCYSWRLEETARTAMNENFDGFTTSLLISPYQKIDMIRNIGNTMAEKYNVEFFFKDFRSDYRTGVALSKELGLYRQKYCGCVYSEMERYQGKIT